MLRCNSFSVTHIGTYEIFVQTDENHLQQYLLWIGVVVMYIYSYGVNIGLVVIRIGFSTAKSCARD